MVAQLYVADPTGKFVPASNDVPVPIEVAKGSAEHGQVTATTEAALLLDENLGRLQAGFYNAGAATVYIGGVGVTAADGIPVASGESFTDDHSVSAWYAITASGTASIRFFEVSLPGTAQPIIIGGRYVGKFYDQGGAVFNLGAMGVVGDGTDQTEAIEAAWLEITDFDTGFYSGVIDGDGGTIYRLKGPTLYFPPGSWGYEGVGLDLVMSQQAKEFRVLGAGKEQCRIKLGDDSYFIDTDLDISKFAVEGIEFVGGKGAIHFRYEGPLARLYCYIRDCQFRDFTECAVGHLSSDWPLIIVDGCYFSSALVGTEYPGICLLLSGLQDGVIVSNTTFDRYLAAIKVMDGGNNLRLHNVQFFRREGTSTPGRTSASASIWIVPAHDRVYSRGEGMVVDTVKFGNENLRSNDYHILYANEDAGSGDSTFNRTWSTTPDTVNAVNGGTYTNCQWYGDWVNSPAVPFIYSYIDNLVGLRVKDILLGGSPDAYLVEFANPNGGSRYNATCLLGPFVHLGLGIDAAGMRPSNRLDMPVLDPNDLTQWGSKPHQYNALDDVEYLPVMNAALATYGAYHVTPVNILDSYNFTNAYQLTYDGTAGAAFYSTFFANLRAGIPVQIEFDAYGSTLSQLTVLVAGTAEGGAVWQRVIRLQANVWQHFRFQWVPKANTSNNFGLQFLSDAPGVVGLGRALVYHSREPIFLGPPRIGTEGPRIYWYYGNPNNNVSATPGSLCINPSGGAGATLWVRESGTTGVPGNTGWVAK